MPLRLATILFFFVASLFAQQSKPQTVFGLEEPVTRPVPVPDRVLQLVRQDALFKQEIESLNDTGSDFTKDWFVASEIDFGCRRGLIVIGQGPLVGANVGPFWIFVADNNGSYGKPLAVLALGVQVRPSRGKSCREIWASSATAATVSTTTFRLKDTELVRHRSWTESTGNSSRSWHPDTGQINQSSARSASRHWTAK